MTDEPNLLLLGPPEVHLGARQLDLGAKRLAILAYVALEGKTSRRHLASLLWPDSEDPLNNLAVARYALTRALGGKALTVDAQSISPGGLSCDVHRWREGLISGDTSVWPLYRGAFLEGFRMSEWAEGYGEEFEAWLYEMRERLEAERRDFALQLALGRLAKGEHLEAMPYLEIAQAGPEPREDASRWLILTAGALGDRDRAARAFAELSRALREELAVEPGAETRAALEIARAGMPESGRTLEHLLETRPRSPQRQAIPYVGQEAALERATDWLAQRADLDLRAVVIRGEPGLGKTRFAEALLERTGSLGKALLKVEGRPAHLPLSALEDGVRSLLAAHPAAVGGLPAVWREALARWLPDVMVTDSPPTEPDLERAAVLRAIQGVLEAVGGEAVLCLEDLHWIDAASLELVQRIAQHPPEGGLAIIATLRDTEPPAADLAATLELLRRRGDVLDWPLDPLEQPAVERLMIGFERPDLSAEVLLWRSGGNPLYLLELLRAAPGADSAQLSELILARLAPLEAPHRQVLEALALLGDAVGAGLLQRVSGRSLTETTEALEALEALGLVHTSEGGARFGHELTREVALGALGEARRGLLHLRAARARREAPLLAAGHYAMARDSWEEADGVVAHQVFVEAGTMLALRGDLDGAQTWFERALEGATSPEARVDAFVARARALERYARYEEADRWLTRAELLLGALEPVRAAAVLNARSDLLIDQRGDAEAGKRAARMAVERLSGVHSLEAHRERARALHLEGWCHFLGRAYALAEGRIREALALNEAIGNRVELASNLAALGVTLVFAGAPGAREILEEAIALARTVGHQTALAYASSSLGMLERRERRFPEAIARFEAAIETRAALGADFVMGSWWTGLGNVYFDMGRFAKSRDAHQRALNTREASENVRLRATALGNLAEADLRLGQFEEARSALEEALALASGIPLPMLEADLWWWSGELHALSGDRAQAERCYERTIDLATRTSHPSRAASGLARLARSRRDPSLAKRALALVDDPAGRVALAFAEGQRDAAALGLAAQGDPYEHLRLALDLADASHDRAARLEAISRLPLGFMAD
jgi:tetratricopeptide (TPR) repeat protein